jgi:hypothetical protein
MKILITAILAVISFSSIAGPRVFNLEVGVTTIAEFKKIYNATPAGVNKYSDGEQFEIPTSQIDFNGLQDVTAIFDSNHKLTAILTSFQKSKFDYLSQALSNKYQTTSRVIPFVGDKKVTYKHDGSTITLNSPHMSFKLSLNYVSDEFNRKFTNQSSQERKARNNKEAQQL